MSLNLNVTRPDMKKKILMVVPSGHVSTRWRRSASGGRTEHPGGYHEAG